MLIDDVEDIGNGSGDGRACEDDGAGDVVDIAGYDDVGQAHDECEDVEGIDGDGAGQNKEAYVDCGWLELILGDDSCGETSVGCVDTTTGGDGVVVIEDDDDNVGNDVPSPLSLPLSFPSPPSIFRLPSIFLSSVPPALMSSMAVEQPGMSYACLPPGDTSSLPSPATGGVNGKVYDGTWDAGSISSCLSMVVCASLVKRANPILCVLRFSSIVMLAATDAHQASAAVRTAEV